MLTYTFSTREKVLLAALAVILLGLLWYQLVFVRVQDQVASLDAQIATTQDSITMNSVKVVRLNKMKESIKQFEESGAHKVSMPDYDNTKPLTAQLNAVLSASDSYSMKSDDLDTQTAGTVKRGITLSYDCASYAVGRSILDALADGPYPCSLDSFSYRDNTDKFSNDGSSGSGGKSPCSMTVHLTFFESTGSVKVDEKAATTTVS